MKVDSNQNPNPNHLMSIFRNVFLTKQFLLILLHIFAKLLNEALREYQQGIIKEKSALEEFANKYVIKGESGVTPFQYFQSKAPPAQRVFTTSSQY